MFLAHKGVMMTSPRWLARASFALMIAAVVLVLAAAGWRSLALAALIFVFWDRPTAAVGIVLAVLLLVALGLIELIGRPPPKSARTPPAASG